MEPFSDTETITLTLRRAKRSDFVHPDGRPLYGHPYYIKTSFGWAVDTLRVNEFSRHYFKTLYNAGKIYVTDDEQIVVPRYEKSKNPDPKT